MTAKITKKMVEEATRECEIEMKKIEGKEDPVVNEEDDMGGDESADVSVDEGGEM